MDRLLKAIAIFLLPLMASCAQETDEPAESVQDRILKAYVEKYYPDATRTESGIYLVDSIPGTGRTPEDTSYVLVDYSITYLDGTYSSYTSDSIAKQLGTYTPSGYYNPRIWSLRNDSKGIVELLMNMKEGGTLKAVVPATLLEGSSTESSSGEGSSKVYEIHLYKVIDNAYTYQIEEMKAYTAEYFPTLIQTEEGFYFRHIRLTADSIDNETEVNVRYIGRYLDGTVFDTNIEDTAKKYGIYVSSNEYEASKFKYYSDEDKAIEENSFIDGFSKALWRMCYGDRAMTYFYSVLGYGDSGKDDIPGFVPLRFDLWVEEKEE